MFRSLRALAIAAAALCALLPATALAAAQAPTASAEPPWIQDASGPLTNATNWPYLNGRGWYTSSTVCVDADATANPANVATLSVRDASGAVLASYTPPAPAAYVAKTLCVPATALVQGAQTLYVNALDTAGNQGRSPYAVYLDSAGAPTVVSATPAPGSATSQRNPAVSVTLRGGSRGIASASATLDGTQPLRLTTGNGTVTLTLPTGSDLSVGVHTVNWSVTDNAGNTYTGSYSFTIADPQISATGALVNGADVGGTGSACALVTVTDSQAAIPNVLVYVDGKLQSSFAGNATAGASVSHNVCVTPSSLGDGPHTLLIRATDTLGVSAQNTWTVNVNSTGPEISATGAMISGATVSGTASACTLVTVTDSLASVPEVYIFIDGNFLSSFKGTTAAGGSTTHNVCLIPASLVNNGPHKMTIKATDSRGVTASTDYTINIGSLGPVITASGPLVSGGTLTGSANVCATVTVTDPQADVPEVDVIVDGKFRTSFKGNAAAGGSASKSVCLIPSSLTAGQHLLTIRAKDSLGSGGTNTWTLTVGTSSS